MIRPFALRIVFVAVPFAAALGGCSGSASAPIGTDTSGLSAAVPQHDWLRLATLTATVQGQILGAPTPEAGQASCQGGPPAMFAALTQSIMTNANGVVDGLLGRIGQITSGPPAAVAPGHATWGPITSPGASAVYRFDVQAVAPSTFALQLTGHPAGGSESTWIGVFQGLITTPDPAHRAGELHVDFGAAHALDPSSDPVAGGVAIHFGSGPEGRAIDETFGGIVGSNAPDPNDAHYVYSEAPDGVRFDFMTRTDFDHDGVANELLNVQSRWLPVGAGKASVVVTGGDLGPRQVAAVECWDPALATVFYADDVNANPPAGDPGCCVP
jgi:hypothetical protein